MGILELNDEDVLNFLMISDFNEQDYSPTELKYLLVKWRYFYRISKGRNEQIKSKSEGDIQQLEYDKNLLNNKINQLSSRIVEKDNLINSLKDRKLTWRERFDGKIILTKDENKILNLENFVSYFSNPESFRKEIFEWLNYKND